MAAVLSPLRLTPKDEDDEIIVSKKGLEELRRQAEQAEERAREIERLRRENAELRRRLRVHENPNVPPSVQNQAPGYSRKRPLTLPEARKKPGAKRGHPGTTRGSPTPDETKVWAAQRCGNCRSSRLKDLGEETTYETEMIPATTKVTKHRQHRYRCADCGEETLAKPTDGRQPTEWGPHLQAEMVLGKVLDRLPYRKPIARMVRSGGEVLRMSPATAQAIVWRASEQFGGEEQAILRRLRASPFVHVDESIFRVDGVRQWIWVFVTEEDLLLVIRDSRARDVVDEVLGESLVV